MFHAENVFGRQRGHRALQPAGIDWVIGIGSKSGREILTLRGWRYGINYIGFRKDDRGVFSAGFCDNLLESSKFTINCWMQPTKNGIHTEQEYAPKAIQLFRDS